MIQVSRKRNSPRMVPRASLEEEGVPQAEGWGGCGQAESSKESVAGEGMGRSSRVKKYVQTRYRGQTYQIKVAHMSKGNFF